jgi:ferric-dicitrate binding protein FerR (iron transport regulator)
MSPADRTAELADRDLEGVLDEAGRRELEGLLNREPGAREAYVRELRLHASLRVTLQGVGRRVRPRRFARRSGFRSRMAAAAAVLLVGVGILAWGVHGRNPRPAPAPPEPFLATIADVTGEAEIPGAGPARAGRNLRAGQGIRAATRESSVSLRLSDGTDLDLGGGEISSIESGKVYLMSGKLEIRARPQPPGRPLRLLTPNAETEILGTQLTLAVAPCSTRIEVAEGKVRVIRVSDRASADVEAGQAVEVASWIPFEVMPSGPGKAALYPGPAGMTPSEDYAVKVDGKPLFVYRVQVNDNTPGWTTSPSPHTGAMAYFDFEGRVSVAVAPSVEFSGAVIHPQSLGIVPAVSGGVISFSLARPARLVLELTGSKKHLCALHLFADAFDSRAPNPADPKVRYFAPGLHESGKIELRDGESLYIAGGAVVRGYLVGGGKRNLRIGGRGILDGSRKEWGKDGFGVHFWDCQDASLEGIILINGIGWNVVPYGSKRVAIRGLKVIGARRNTDGIDILNSQDVTIEGCFLRCWDDNITPKGYMAFKDRPVSNVTVTDCFLWNDMSHVFRIGAEACAPAIENVTLRNCDLVARHWGVFDLAVMDNAHVRNILFEDCRVYVTGDRPDRFLWCRIEKPGANDGWEHSSELGRISDITWRNVNVIGPRFPPSTLEGLDAAHDIRNLTFEGLKHNGTPLLSAEQAGIKAGKHVDGLVFRAAAAPKPPPPQAPPPKPSVRLADPAAPAAWKEKLRARAREAAAAGAAPRFPFSALGAVTLLKLDPAGGMTVRPEGGGEAAVNWAQMTDRDCLGLARALAEAPGTSADHALAAFFLLASGDAAQAERHLSRSGPHAEAVRAAFAAADGGKR